MTIKHIHSIGIMDGAPYIMASEAATVDELDALSVFWLTVREYCRQHETKPLPIDAPSLMKEMKRSRANVRVAE